MVEHNAYCFICVQGPELKIIRRAFIEISVLFDTSET